MSEEGTPEFTVREALDASLAKRSVGTMDPVYSAAFNAALDMVRRDVDAALGSRSPGANGEEGARGEMLSPAEQAVIAERRHQIAKGWTPEHDDQHDDGEIRIQAGYLLAGHNIRHPRTGERTWVDPERHNMRERLVIAAALLIAEIERLDRAYQRPDDDLERR